MKNIVLNRKISSRIVNLIADKEVVPSHIMKELAIPSATFYNCMNSKREWSTDNLIKIAEYFKVTLDYLITGNMQNNEQRVYALEKENELLKQQLMVICQNIPAEILAKAFKDAKKTEGK